MALVTENPPVTNRAIVQTLVPLDIPAGLSVPRTPYLRQGTPVLRQK